MAPSRQTNERVSVPHGKNEVGSGTPLLENPATSRRSLIDCAMLSWPPVSVPRSVTRPFWKSTAWMAG